MTAENRKSISVALEIGDFGSGEVANNLFYTLPPGTYITHTSAREAESIYASGSKHRQAAAYGRFQGSWTLKHVMDYSHIEILNLVFEKHEIEATSKRDDEGNVIYKHTFSKANNTRIPHFVFREKILNRIAGGADDSDEVSILKGCIARSVTFTRTMSSSKMQVEWQGLYADHEVLLGALDSTDYTEYESDDLTQYSCMFMDSLENEDYVKDVDSHRITIDMADNSLIYSTCTPIATSYMEGRTQYSWDAQTYSNDPRKKFKLRPFSGGKDSNHMQPAAKDLGPMKDAYFATYSGSYRDEPDEYTSIADAVEKSPFTMVFHVIDSTVRSMTWPSGDGTKMMDSLSSVECTKIVLTIENTIGPTTDWHYTIEGGTSTPGISPDPAGYIEQDSVRYDMAIAATEVISGAQAADEAFVTPDALPLTISTKDRWAVKGYVRVFDGTTSTQSLDGWYVLDPATVVDTTENTTLLQLFTTEDDEKLIAEDLTDSVTNLTVANAAPTWEEETVSVTKDGETTTVASFSPSVTVSVASGETFANPTGDVISAYFYVVKLYAKQNMDGDEPEANSRTIEVLDKGVLRVDIVPIS